MVILLKQHVVASYMCWFSYPFYKSMRQQWRVHNTSVWVKAQTCFFFFLLHVTCYLNMLYPSTYQVYMYMYKYKYNNGLTEKKCFFVVYHETSYTHKHINNTTHVFIMFMFIVFVSLPPLASWSFLYVCLHTNHNLGNIQHNVFTHVNYHVINL